MEPLTLVELMRAKLAEMTSSDISSSVRSVMNNVVIIGSRHYPPVVFLRMRAAKALVRHTNDISYNPIRAMVGWGRCNRPENSLFYASNSPLGLAQEINAKTGDILNLGYWRSRAPLLVSTFGFSEGVRNRLGTELRFPAGQELPDSTSLNRSTDKVHQFLINAFTEVVGASEEHKYMLTTAIADVLLGDIESSSEHCISETRFDGVQFPSIASRGNFLNFALRPEVVDSSLELFRVEAFEVQGVRGTEYDVLPLATGIPASNGTIAWLGDFEYKFTVQLAKGVVTVIHGAPDFRILTPDSGEAAGF
jgi:hypothetical protein